MKNNVLEKLKEKKKVIKLCAFVFLGAISILGLSHTIHATLSPTNSTSTQTPKDPPTTKSRSQGEGKKRPRSAEIENLQEISNTFGIATKRKPKPNKMFGDEFELPKVAYVSYVASDPKQKESVEKKTTRQNPICDKSKLTTQEEMEHFPEKISAKNPVIPKKSTSEKRAVVSGVPTDLSAILQKLPCSALTAEVKDLCSCAAQYGSFSKREIRAPDRFKEKFKSSSTQPAKASVKVPGKVKAATATPEKPTIEELNREYDVAWLKFSKNERSYTEEILGDFTKLANKNYGPAMYMVGMYYWQQGYHLAKDESKCKENDFHFRTACACFKKGTQLGNLSSQYMLGLCYELGKGIKKADYDIAFAYIAQAAEKEYYPALKWMKDSAVKGYGPALKWLENASETDDGPKKKEAQRRLESVRKQLSKNPITASLCSQYFIADKMPTIPEEKALIDIPLISLVPKGLHGIENIGNSCYFNATIQQLYRDTEFRKYLINLRNYIILEESVETLEKLEKLKAEYDQLQACIENTDAFDDIYDAVKALFQPYDIFVNPNEVYKHTHHFFQTCNFSNFEEFKRNHDKIRHELFNNPKLEKYLIALSEQLHNKNLISEEFRIPEFLKVFETFKTAENKYYKIQLCLHLSNIFAALDNCILQSVEDKITEHHIKDILKILFPKSYSKPQMLHEFLIEIFDCLDFYSTISAQKIKGTDSSETQLVISPLTLYISEKCSISEALNHHFNINPFNYTHMELKQGKAAEERNRITQELPPTLIISLCEISDDPTDPDEQNSGISVDLEGNIINLEAFCAPGVKGSKKYRLIGMVKADFSRKKGHGTSYVKIDDHWFLIDDGDEPTQLKSEKDIFADDVSAKKYNGILIYEQIPEESTSVESTKNVPDYTSDCEIYHDTDTEPESDMEDYVDSDDFPSIND